MATAINECALCIKMRFTAIIHVAKPLHIAVARVGACAKRWSPEITNRMGRSLGVTATPILSKGPGQRRPPGR